MNNIKEIEDCILNNPLPLLTIENKGLIEIINNYLPYSIGFEIECNKSQNFNIENFKSIPYIIDCICDSGEQRFRVPNGLCGILCLYNISNELKINSELNEDSGIHYHVDFTKCFKLINSTVIEENSNWILEELDNWNYKGSYNNRRLSLGDNDYSTWLKFNKQYSTAEFRIGEMTFDYELLIKRILHLSKICKKLKDSLNVNNRIEYIDFDKLQVINHIKNYYSNIKSKLINNRGLKHDIVSKNDFKNIEEINIENIINNRIIKL